MKDEEKLVEGLLFLAGSEGMSFSDLVQAAGLRPDHLVDVLDAIAQSYEGHGISLQHFGNVYKFLADDLVYEPAMNFYSRQKERKLSRASLETLAIIAYNPFITRSEIEEIRGVNSESILKNLLALDLIQSVESEKSRARLFQTTPYFLDFFGLDSLASLPEIKEEETKEIALFKDRDEIEKELNPSLISME